MLMQCGEGGQIFQKKHYEGLKGSMLFALRGRGWVFNFQKKALRNTLMAPNIYIYIFHDMYFIYLKSAVLYFILSLKRF